MKKLLFVLMLSLSTVASMAQYHGQQPPQQNPPYGQHDHGNPHGNQPGHNDPHHQGNQPGHNDPHHHGPQPGHQPGHHPGQQPAPQIICATAEQMTMVLQVLEKQPYDDKRMEIAKLCVMLANFCTSDLARMASRFTMEDRKVDFLIYAYPYCTDPQNYPLLRDALRYKSDYDRLMDTVQPNRPRY